MGYKITIKGEAKTSHPNLEDLDGIDCQENFSEYFDDSSYADVVSGGYMRFEYDGSKLWTITTYNSERELTEDELDDLGAYTQGQWSDGIGEGFEQFPCMEDDNGEDIYISPWSPKQTLTFTQIKK